MNGSHNLGAAIEWRPHLASVVVPTRNRPEGLGAQLGALSRQTYAGAWEVVVADNSSTDGTVEVARRWANDVPQIRVVTASPGRGVAYARNVGAAAARGDFLAFCDDDDLVCPHWLDALVEAARHAHLVGGRTERVTTTVGSVQPCSPATPDQGLPRTFFLPYALGGTSGIRADVFRTLGGWSERNAYGGEDVDLSWRAQLSGYTLDFAPEAVIRCPRRGPEASFRRFYLFGRAEAGLYARFRDRGAPRPRLPAMLRGWAWLVLHLPDLAASPERRMHWVRTAALRCGRLVGGVRNGVLYI